MSNFFKKLWSKLDPIIEESTEKGQLVETPPDFSVLSNGMMTYGLETTRQDMYMLNSLFANSPNERKHNKWYYENIPFFADCVDIYVDVASQVDLKEVDSNGNVIENSRFVEFLQKPNIYQDFTALIREAVINTLVDGLNIQYSNAVERGDLYTSMQNVIYNLDWCNIEMPKIENPYLLTQKEYDNLPVKEYLEGGRYRTLKLSELMFVYDRAQKNTFGGNSGYSSSKFFNPIARSKSLIRDFNILLNTSNTMEFVSGKNISAIVSKDSPNGELAPLGTAEKSDIESKLSGYGKYGTKRGQMDMIAVAEYLKVNNIQRNNRMLNLVEMQNNAKENIRSRYGVPRDLIDAYNGTNRGSTYENQQFAEARFTTNNVKSITDMFWYTYERRYQKYFSNGNRLIGSYEHTPAMIAINGKLKNEGFNMKADAFIKLLDAYQRAQGIEGMESDFDKFIDDNGFRDYIKQND